MCEGKLGSDSESDMIKKVFGKSNPGGKTKFDQLEIGMWGGGGQEVVCFIFSSPEEQNPWTWGLRERKACKTHNGPAYKRERV